MSTLSSFELPPAQRHDSVLEGIGSSGAPSPDHRAFRSMKISLQLEAAALPNMDLRGKSDPFLIIYEKSHGSVLVDNWVKIGQTETVYNSLFPKWSTTFTLDYHFGGNTVLKFNIYDRDSIDDDVGKHDYIGEVRCTVAQVVLADNQRLQLPIFLRGKPDGSRGTLTIRGEELKGDLGDSVTLQFSVYNLRKGRKPFYVLSRRNTNDSGFSPIYYSEVHQRYAGVNQETEFRPFSKSLTRIVNGDLDRELQIEFNNFDRRGAHYRGGSAIFTLRSAKAAAANPMAYRIELKKQKTKGTIVGAGTLVIKTCDISAQYSFIDYIQSGVIINTVIAVDMSSSNGHPDNPTSLQYKNLASPNEYVIALRAVGEVLAAYDTSQTFPSFGFGAALPPNYGEAEHVFALSGDIQRPICNGIEQVIQTYYNALNNVAPFEPCKYGPMLEHVIRTAKAENSRSGKIVYTILLLITDGKFCDFAEVANLICAAADLPLSIVIVGVGKSEFSKLEKLDGDQEPLCSSDGTPCGRDIVQFVQFQKHRYNTHQLAKEVLDEIPEQFLSYMRSKGIRPKNVNASGDIADAAVSLSLPYYPNNEPRNDALKRNFSTNSNASSMHSGGMHSGAMHSVAMHSGAMHSGAMHSGVHSLSSSVASGVPVSASVPAGGSIGGYGRYNSTHASYLPQQSKYMPPNANGATPRLAPTYAPSPYASSPYASSPYASPFTSPFTSSFTSPFTSSFTSPFTPSSHTATTLPAVLRTSSYYQPPVGQQHPPLYPPDTHGNYVYQHP